MSFGQLQISLRHLEDVGAAVGIEHVLGLAEKMLEELAIVTVADEVTAGIRRNVAYRALEIAAIAADWETDRHGSPHCSGCSLSQYL